MVPDSSQDCPPACYVIEPGESPETSLKRMRQRLHIRGRNEDPYSAPRYQTKVAAERFDDRAHLRIENFEGTGGREGVRAQAPESLDMFASNNELGILP